jgi:hypothetical protein
MGSASQVPETLLLGKGELSTGHAWRAPPVRGWPLLRDALAGFRQPAAHRVWR